MKLNLGGGRGWRQDGWSNLEAALGYDLSEQLLTPFPERSIHKIYTSHTLEHLSPPVCYRLLKDCARVMATGAILRVVVPDCETHIRQFLNGENTFFIRNERYFSSPAEQVSLMGGNPDGLESPSCTGHFFFWDFFTLAWLLHMAGFCAIKRLAFGISDDPEFVEIARLDGDGMPVSGFDNPNTSHLSVYLEARKP